MNNPTTSPQPASFPTLLITHTDRDGIFSGASLLRSLGGTCAPEVLLTQGSYLAYELEDLVAQGRRFLSIFATDTYWHEPHGERIARSLDQLLAPGGEVTWIDHHPSSVEGEAWMRSRLPLSAHSRIVGDRAGKHEAVSLVAESFGTAQDPVVSLLLKATYNGWARNKEPLPMGVWRWLAVVDGLARTPDLPAMTAALIVQSLSHGFENPVPEVLEPLENRSQASETRTLSLLVDETWKRLPSTKGGCGLLLDLREEPLANAYELAVGLFRNAGRRVDYFIVQEAPGQTHFVSGPTARATRDRLESGQMPALRVSTMHKGGFRKASTWRSAQGIDLEYMTRREPATALLGPWINAHPYLVKAPWRTPEATAAFQAATDEIAREMQAMLQRYGWGETDRMGTPKSACHILA